MFGRGFGRGLRGLPGPGGPGLPGRGLGRGLGRAVGPHAFIGGEILFLLVALVVLGVIVFALWRVLTKAGYNGAWSLIALVPCVGLPALLLFLAFAEWPPLVELGRFRAHGAEPVPAAPVPESPAAPSAEAETVIVPTAPMTRGEPLVPAAEPPAPSADASVAPTVPIETPKRPRGRKAD